MLGTSTGEPVSVFVNRYERAGIVSGCLLFALLGLTGVLVDPNVSGKMFGAALLFACSGYAWRCRRRPRLDLTADVVLVRSVLWTTKIRVEEIEAWRVEQRVIGAFTRECLCVKRFGSEFRSLGQRGMYVRRAGPQFEELQRLVEVLPVRGRPFRGLPGGS